ncbi:Protein of unknown function [Bacillus wiedmannii]|nr:Protein of unknown function [Bacillus wiedmannii]
MRYLFIIG